MKMIFSLLFIALSISLNAYSVRPVPPHTRTGDMNLRARDHFTLKVGQRGYYLYNNSSMIGYDYKFEISDKSVLVLDKFYQLTPFRENYRGNYIGETVDYIHFYKAVKKGKTTLTAMYVYKGKVMFKDIIHIKVI